MVMHSIIFDVTDRKQMEAKAAALLLRHQTLLQAGSDGIHILDENGSVLEVNLAFCQMLGYSREELLRLHVADWDVQFPKTELPALIAQLLATTRVFETRHRTKNGAILEVEINARGITLEGKKLLFASARDITERKRLELEVREQRNLLVSIIEGTNVGTWRWNVVTGQTEFNERWAEITGYTLAELAPVSIQTWHGLAHPDGLQESARVLAEHFSGATRHYDFEGRMRHKNGSWVWVHDRGKVIEWTADGQPLMMTGTRSDITPRKQVEDTLRKYSWALEQSPTSVVITNAIGNIEFVNPCFCRVTGYTAAECLGQNPRILKSGQTPPQEYRQLWEAITHGEEWHGDFLNKKKNGEFYWERAHISAIKNQHGQITHYLALKEDITAHKQAESDLLETNRSLELATARANELAVRSELASAAKSDFLANMSHEIRTPMNGVLGMLGLLQGTLQTEEQRQYTAAARASGETLLALINDILDFSKIEAGKMELETVDFNLPILLDDFTEMMAPRAHQKDLVFGCVVAPQIPPALQGDPGRLRQILTNLAANAIKFTDHGQVVIRVDPVAETAGEVQLHFSVHDTGIGIPEDKLSRLFAKFTQVDSSTTRLYGGSGLGLAISKQLVEMMGGEIGVHSVVGQGAEFWFRIRLPKNPALNLAPEPLHAGLRGLRVLVVESQAIHCETLLGLLKAWGMRPEAAGTAAAALPALAQAQSAHDGFALAILQQELPDQDAFALSGLIKRHPDLKATKLVLGLPLGQKPLISDGGGDLFAATLSLPVHRNKLRAVLESVVCGKTPSASPAHVLPGLAAVNKSQRARILVVDDNATNQLVAVGILKKLGLNTEVAGAGAEAVQALETADFDLVLMDAQMPGMDGLQATRIIRDPQSSVRNHHVPIIAMTARAMLGDREECLQAGMDDYLTKPFEVPALIAILEKWLPSPRQNPPSQDLPVAPAQPASGSGAEPIFDRAEFLDRIMNDEAIAREVISAFMADLPVQIAKLKAYAAAGDATQVGKQAHKIKGAAANVSAGALRALTAALEAAGSANNQALIAQKLTELDRQYEALLAAVAQVF
jgi:PAS domain S-box-containing protein